ncbi:uncharacterized protein SPSC_03809 [Sporisorium scitamineum]|uniref:Endonuclease/exonuclease/phosphatase domain-containing protein n=1 Tax=Sporisorium scitamineum TaxID=49012 RepID=A0A127ZE92_9BASI|nr:uncharacterized protein SPSC_03809 [Sporisorium scitamineum]
MPSQATFAFWRTNAPWPTLATWSGAPPARVKPIIFTSLRTAPTVNVSTVDKLATVLHHVPLKSVPRMVMRLWWFNRQVKMLVGPISWTAALLKHTQQAGSFVVATWNCTMLNAPDCVAALHNRSTLLGKADVVLLQEMYLVLPESLPLFNPFLHLHHPFSTEGHQVVLGKDTGILICNPKWEIEESAVHDYATYARVCIPPSEPAVGESIHTLHLWSIHVPPDASSCSKFWNADIPEISRLDIAAADNQTGTIIGADLNAVLCPLHDNHPPNPQSGQIPTRQLAQAGLVDTFHMLHPHAISYTRHNMLCGELVLV